MDAADVVLAFADPADGWGLAANQLGNVEAWDDGDGWNYAATAAVTLGDDDCAVFRDWAARALTQLAETGNPAGNGWYPSRVRPGHWYMTCAGYQFGP